MIPNKAIAALVGILAGAAGFIIGALSRQPEINDLHKQVQSLQKQVAYLQEIVEGQNKEIAELTLKYQALKVYQIFRKSELRAQLRESLTFQYATADYFELLIKHLDTGEKLDDEEADFYYAFSLMLAGKELSDEQKADIRDYVTANHAYEIESLIPCDVKPALEELADYGKSKADPGKEFWFKFPKIEPPNIPNPFKRDGEDECHS